MTKESYVSLKCLWTDILMLRKPNKCRQLENAGLSRITYHLIISVELFLNIPLEIH